MMGHKLLVHMIQAHGLKHLNHFTGDHPYCVCEVKHADSHAHPTMAETQPVTTGDVLNPVWDEAFEIDPWQEGESLEFTIYDKGLIGAKTEGKVLLPAEAFFPNGFSGMINISALPGAFLQVDVQILPTTGVEAPMAESPAPLTHAVPAEACAKEATQKLGISILEAQGLQHMNHFTGDHPYVTCEIKHFDQAKSTKIETRPMTEGDTQNPFWGETHYLDSWQPGEPLEFTIYDKGLIGSKTEGKAVLPSELFSPQGFTGMIPISGLPHALLHVIVRVLGQTAPAQEEGVTKSNKQKKLKKKKKSKSCC